MREAEPERDRSMDKPRRAFLIFTLPDTRSRSVEIDARRLAIAGPMDRAGKA